MSGISFGSPCTRLRAPEISDGYGGKDRNWDAAVAADLGSCVLDPGTSNEPTADARSSVVSQPSALFPGSFPEVLPTDRLLIRERTWEVDGDAGEYVNPWSGFGGLVVRLKAVEG